MHLISMSKFPEFTWVRKKLSGGRKKINMVPAGAVPGDYRTTIRVNIALILASSDFANSRCD